MADFGLSKENVKDNEIARSFCGSPAYLPPEIVSKKGLFLLKLKKLKILGSGKAGDIYAIGTVLYEMLIGFPPFFNEDIKILFSNIQKGHLEFTKTISSNAKDLIKVL